ncbi:MAG: DHH family phosphoesterase [Lachnospiraceae bacterium]|nr:DHH family phosphoesterase [Lachnospiraceae bacterium]
MKQKNEKQNVKLRGKIRRYLQFSLYLGILLAFVDVLVYLVDVTAGVIISVYLLGYFIIVAWLMAHYRQVFLRELVDFATAYGQLQGQLLREFDIPYALLDEQNRCLWANNAFKTLVNVSNIRSKSITQFFSMMTKDRMPGHNGEEDSTFEFTYQEKEYRVQATQIFMGDLLDENALLGESEEESYVVALYFYDETALKFALREVDDQSVTVGLMYLDNYDEALASIEEVRRSLLIALIDRKINKYVSSVDGICRKLEDDKYLVVLRKKSLKQLQERKFDILDDVKTVSIGNDMAVTMSIGIGYGGITYAQCYGYAQSAIDLALARGGDQAVVRNNNETQYFGGKSQSMARNSRVKARVKAHALKELIYSREQVMIMGHKNPDADCFGAAVGVYRIARDCDKKAYIVLDDPQGNLNSVTGMFAGQQDYEEDMMISSRDALELITANTVVVVVDVNKPALTACPELLRISQTIVVIDHHRQGVETIENPALSYIESYASSACEMVSEILQYASDNLKLRPEEADCMYAGIVVDTNNFMNQAGVRTFEAAAFLRRNGADVTRVRKLFRTDAADYKAKAEASSQAQIYRNYYAISFCSAEEEGILNPTVVGAQVANELLSISSVKASFVLTPFQGRVYISARSIDEVNVQVIMEKMGGGGHMTTAACQLDGVTAAEAESALKRTIDTMIEDGDLK